MSSRLKQRRTFLGGNQKIEKFVSPSTGFLKQEIIDSKRSQIPKASKLITNIISGALSPKIGLAFFTDNQANTFKS